MSSTKWVDFREVKSHVSIVDILARYGLLEKLRQKGDAYEGPCPIHGGTSPKQFRVSVSKNCWNCFGPCPGGNVIDFVAQMEKTTIRQAALLLAEWFEIPTERRHKRDQPQQSPAAPAGSRPSSANIETDAEDVRFL